jgi:putative ABC transport system permease protein
MIVWNQITSVTIVNLLSIPSRWGPTFVMLIGVAAASAVIAAVHAFIGGFDDSLRGGAIAERVIILSDGARDGGDSQLSNEQIKAISVADGIARTPSGEPSMTRDAFVSVSMLGKRDGVSHGVVVRGYSSALSSVRPEIHIVEGRMFRPGLREAVIGRQAQMQFQDASIGDPLPLESGSVAIVGVFESGDWAESCVIMDTDVLLNEYGRTGANLVSTRLATASSLATLKASLASNASLRFQVLTEPEYYARFRKTFSLFDGVAGIVGGMMALGAVFCAFNAMYISIAARERDTAIFRAIGFSRTAIVVSVVVESVLVSVAGAAAGAFVAWLLFNGMTVTTGSYLLSVIHTVDVSRTVVSQSMLWSCAIGVLGALWPSIQAVRQPVSMALAR